MSEPTEYIEIYGAREHNLKDISLKIPRERLVVITGVSGSGKSSLAFDTIYAEGQRRYMETFSAYARSFIGNMERPDVDKIDGLSPVISIEQKTTSRNPRSTVGTTTEIYDFLRLLYARAGEAYSYVTGEKMVRQTEEQVIKQILSSFSDKKLVLLAPLVKGRKGHYRELFEQIRKLGFLKVRVDGEMMDIAPKMQVDRYKTHDIEVVVDRIVVNDEDVNRIRNSIRDTLNRGKGTMIALEYESNKEHFFSKHLMCPTSGIAYDDPAPNMFSFNSPYGACPTCKGLGTKEEISVDAIIPNKSLSILQGAIVPYGDYKNTNIFRQVEDILSKYKASVKTKAKDIPQEALDIIMHGTDILPSKSIVSEGGVSFKFRGVFSMVEDALEQDGALQRWAKKFTVKTPCETCGGTRLRKESLHFRIDDKNIAELAQLDVTMLGEWMNQVEERLDEKQKVIAENILKEIRKRIRFLLDVGLDYLTLDRQLKTLSGGESQRIRLATQIGTQLVGVLYIMDEPSIGLHQRDNHKLISALKDLRDLGNSVIVVEHDKDMMLASDHIIDIGPLAGRKGGHIIGEGNPEEFLKNGGTTASYLNGNVSIEIPTKRRAGNGDKIVLKGATGNNLQNVNISIPLGKMVCVSGVSGGGKSSLIHNTLVPILKRHFYNSVKDPLPYKSITGIEYIDKVIEIDQSPIGRTPRSNPATYTGVFADIRTLFTMLPEAKIRGYKAGRFSFNVKGGRCETCQGGGMRTIEMNFLPDVYVPCETCKGQRYNRETLEVRYKGKSINDVLEMSVNEAVEFFDKHPKILRKVKVLQEVGLGYITVGQQATTLSGGEAQRVKLATELAKRDTGQTMYVLDEPTTGLHFKDIQMLLDVLNILVDKGNTVLIIEHNMDIIKVADYVVDLGPEGGSGGGMIVAEGTPEQVAKNKDSFTGQFLKEELVALTNKEY